VPVLDLSSDHSPIIATIGASLTNKAITPTLATAHTNWDMFRAYIDEHINLRLRIKECAELDEATQYYTTLIQAASWHSTPHSAQGRSLLTTLLSTYVNSLLKDDDGAVDGNGRETKATDLFITD
jgi:hypothetical protein